MKTLVIYYSYTGKTRALAVKLAEELGADRFEVRDTKRPGTIKAYVLGSFAAMRMKRTSIGPLTVDMDAFDKIVIMAPIWAGHPAPAILSALDALPPGKAVEVRAVSASGGSSAKAKVEALLKEKGCADVRYQDMKA